MPERMDIEVGDNPSERGRADKAKRRWEELTEALEVVILAIAAIATAWSGYQAARGDGHQSVLYGESSRDRFEADAAATLGEQRLAADASMFNAWLQARAARDPRLQASFVRRFSPEYRGAFEAWLKTDPFTDPAAPPGPGYMPEYHNPQMEEASRLNAQASAAFQAGTEARETADRYVRVTVVFALVLFLVAVGQRFKLLGVRIGAMGLSVGLLVYGLIGAATLPRF
jgi:hypothetical protein